MTRRRSLLLAALAAAWLLALAWAYHGYAMDDAYIGYRYAANVASGKGFSFNPPEAVEGVTNTGWVLLLAAFAAVGVEPPAAAPALAPALLGLALALTFLSSRSVDRLGAGFGRVPALAVAVAATHAELSIFSFLGMETAALAALLAAIVFLAGRGRLAWLPPLGALAFLLHPEAALAVPLGGVLAWKSGALGARKLAAGALAYGSCLGAITLARWAVFGAFLPNTFHAKPFAAAGFVEHLASLAAGTAVNAGFPFAGLFALPFVVAGFFALRRVDPLGASFAGGACLAGIAFAVYAPPDWTALGRYFAPYAPAAALLLATGLVRAERAVMAGEPGGRAVRRVALALAGATLAAGALAFSIYRPHPAGLLDRSLVPLLGPALLVLWAAALEIERARRTRRSRPTANAAVVVVVVMVGAGAALALEPLTERSRLAFPGYVLTGRTLLEPALWMRDHLAPGTSVATRRIGVVSYVTGRPVFDYAYGLTEREVARLIHARGRMFELPSEPELAAFWRDRRPDYLLEDREVMGALARAAGGSLDGFTVHGLRYRAIHRFPIGAGAEWVLAERVPRPGGASAARSWSRVASGGEHGADDLFRLGPPSARRGDRAGAGP